MSKTRTALTTTTSVDDRLALVGGQEWNVSGVKLLKQLLYQHTTKVEIPTYFGANAAGQDVTFYGTTASKYAMWDESEDRFEILGGADLYFEGASASHYLLWDGDNQRMRSTGKIDWRYVGSTAANYVEWSAANDRFQSGGKADFKWVMSGTSLDKEGSRNQFMVDASANVIKLLGHFEVSTVGPTTAVSGLGTHGNAAALYLTGANSIGFAVMTAGGNVRYGSLTNSSTAY